MRESSCGLSMQRGLQGGPAARQHPSQGSRALQARLGQRAYRSWSSAIPRRASWEASTWTCSPGALASQTLPPPLCHPFVSAAKRTPWLRPPRVLSVCPTLLRSLFVGWHNARVWASTGLGGLKLNFLRIFKAQRPKIQQPSNATGWAVVHRPAKVFGAAHFTLRCGRRLPDGSYQRPLVALACNFGAHILSLAQAGHPCELLTQCRVRVMHLLQVCICC